MHVSADSIRTEPAQDGIYPSTPFVVYFTVELEQGETDTTAQLLVTGDSTTVGPIDAPSGGADAQSYETYAEVAGLPAGQFWLKVQPKGGTEIASIALSIGGSTRFSFDQPPDVQPARPGPQQALTVTWQGKNDGDGVSPDTGVWDHVRIFDAAGEVKGEAWFQVPATWPGTTYNGQAEIPDGLDAGYYVVTVDQEDGSGTTVPSPQRALEVQGATEM